MTITDDQLSALLVLAADAAQGSWASHGGNVDSGALPVAWCGNNFAVSREGSTSTCGPKNAAYIAAAGPSVVTELVKEIQRLRRTHVQDR